MKVSVVLLAAGSGRRMGGSKPKAFLTLGGRPLYRHALETFRAMREVRQIILVVPKGIKVPGSIEGGSRRQDSVQKGLREVDPAADVVLIHDAARPFVTPETVRRVIQGALKHEGAVPGVPVRDTLKRVEKGDLIRATLDREGLWAVQTPQGFRKGVLEAAYASGHGLKDATDDAQIVERAGGRVAVVEGNSENCKITSKIDLKHAEDYLRQRRRPRTTRGTPVFPPVRRRT
jgi:2-C-methyl-D-erythritol 4-phosphate cytidylyltransferase